MAPLVLLLSFLCLAAGVAYRVDRGFRSTLVGGIYWILILLLGSVTLGIISTVGQALILGVGLSLMLRAAELGLSAAGEA